jgi:predicted enzyme related to lactoylglutathione lyase
MEIVDFTLNLTSEDPERLIAFYRDVVGLAPDEKFGHSLKAGPARLRITGHSKTKGASRDPTRALINLFVTDVQSEFDRLRDRDVTVIRPPDREPWGGLVSTFADPDGNYFQVIEAPDRPSSDAAQ